MEPVRLKRTLQNKNIKPKTDGSTWNHVPLINFWKILRAWHANNRLTKATFDLNINNQSKKVRQREFQNDV